MDANTDSEDFKDYYISETRSLFLGTDGQTVGEKSHGNWLLYLITSVNLLLYAQKWGKNGQYLHWMNVW